MTIIKSIIALSVVTTLFGSQSVHSQDVIFVSNINRATFPSALVGRHTGGTSNLRRAQVFQTGNNAGGYKLSSVLFYLESYQADEEPYLEVTLHQWSNSTDFPDNENKILTFSNSTVIELGQKNFFVPNDEATEEQKTLAANSSYTIKFVLRNPDADGGNWIEVPSTENFSESALGSWTIKNFGLERFAGQSWQRTTEHILAMEVNGTLISDDPVVFLDVNPRRIDENGGVGTISGIVSPSSDTDFTVDIEVSPVTASPSDYTISTPAYLTFAANATESDEVSITAVDDSVLTGDRTVLVTSSTNAGVVLTDESIVVMIVEDESGVVAPTNFTANPTHNSVVLAWVPHELIPSDHRFQYQMKIGDGSFGNWIDIPKSKSSQVNFAGYIVENLVSDTNYEFKLRGRRGTTYSEEVETSAATFSPFMGEFTLLPPFSDYDTGLVDPVEPEVTFNSDFKKSIVFAPAHGQATYENAIFMAKRKRTDRTFFIRIRPNNSVHHATVTLKAAPEPHVRCTQAEADTFKKICSIDLRPLVADVVGTVRAHRKARLRLNPSSISENGGVATVTAALHKFANGNQDRLSKVPFHIDVSVAPVSPAVAADYAFSANTRLSFAANRTSSTGTVTITAQDNSDLRGVRKLAVSGVSSVSHVTMEGTVELTINEDDIGLVPPTDVTLTPAYDGVRLSWNPDVNTGEHAYQYQYKQGDGEFGSWTDIPDSGVGLANHSDYFVSGLTSDTTYTFSIRAVTTDPDAQGQAVEVATTTLIPYTASFPNAPSHFNGDSVFDLLVEFDRNLRTAEMLKKTENTDKVVVEGGTFGSGRRETQGQNVRWLLKVTPDTTASEVVVTLKTGTAPHIKCGGNEVNRICSSARHPLTAEATITLQRLVVPSTPTNLEATPGEDSMQLSWVAPSGSTPASKHRHRFKVGTGEFNGWTDIADSADGEANAISFTLSGLASGQAHTIQVRAVNDAGESTPAEVTATTNAATNNAPVFNAGLPSSVSVAENTAADTAIGSPFTATDADPGDTVAYSLEGTDQDSFAIDSTNGQLKTKAELDHEIKNSHSVTIVASDAAESVNHALTVSVTDVDEPPAAPAAPTLSSRALTSLTVAWTAPTNAGRPAIDDYDVQYRAGSSGPYSSGPEDVSGTSGEITGLSPGTVYEVQVRATNDEGDGDWSDTLTVPTDPVVSIEPKSGGETVTEGTDAAAVFTFSRTGATTAALTVGVAVTEVGSFISGTAPTSAAFTANSSTTELSVPIEDDTTDETSGEIKATLKAGTGYTLDAASSDAKVIVNDDDSANNAPIFNAGLPSSVSVAENSAADTDIGSPFTATDADAGDTVAYSLGGTDKDSFALDASTRQLKTKAALDYETKTSYAVMIEATDGTAMVSHIVSVNVTNVDELPAVPAAPTLDSRTLTSLTVSWTAPSNTGNPEIRHYDVRYRAGTSGGYSNGPQDVTGTSATLASLTSGTTYEVQVRATNSDGDTDWSSALTASTDPVVSIEPKSGGETVTEGTDAAAVFTFSRTGATTAALTVGVAVTEVGSFIGGTAPTSAAFTANSSTTELSVPHRRRHDGRDQWRDQGDVEGRDGLHA